MPPFGYFGGKATLAPLIADMLPAHEHYVEPFAGSLAVLLAKQPATWETANDLDGDLVTFWRVLRDHPKELARAASLTPHSRSEFVAARDLDAPTDDVERARRIWVTLSQSRSNSMRTGGWRYKQDPTATGSSMPEHLGTYARRMEAAAERLRNVSLESRDAVDLIRDYGRHPSVCIYADPPYLGSTRATGYRHEMLDHDQHVALADALNGCQASVVLSGYDSPLYADLFGTWYSTRLKAPTALSGGTGARRSALEQPTPWRTRPIYRGARMSTQTLRKAAALMRERAQGVERATRVNGCPPWWSPKMLMAGSSVAFMEDAAHIASWHPAVALAVADLLDRHARMCEEFQVDEDDDHATLAVARAYLGVTP